MLASHDALPNQGQVQYLAFACWAASWIPHALLATIVASATASTVKTPPVTAPPTAPRAPTFRAHFARANATAPPAAYVRKTGTVVQMLPVGASSAGSGSTAQPEAVRYLKTDRRAQHVYIVHTGPDAASAKAFLSRQDRPAPLHYIIVETPEGVWGRDIDGGAITEFR